jgi:hypothetical protein
MWFEGSQAWGLAEAAPAVLGEVPGRKGIPISPDHHFPTGMAIGAGPFFVVQIAGLDMPQALGIWKIAGVVATLLIRPDCLSTLTCSL